MANTYSLLSATTIGSNVYDITFSNIPQTFNDLIMKVSLRGNYNVGTFTFQNMVRPNNNMNSVYSMTGMQGTGSSVVATATPTPWGQTMSLPMYTLTTNSGHQNANNTANVFGTYEYYFPDYTTASPRQHFSTAAAENNGSTSYIEIIGNYYSASTAISSIYIGTYSSDAFIPGTTFYLYGIKTS